MSPARERQRAAAVLGVASGARCFAGAAALALHGRPESPWARGALLAVAAGEVVGDKLPSAPPRRELPSLVGRVVCGAASGAAVDGRRGAILGAAFALAGTYATERARAVLVERTGLPDPVVAVAEDLVTYGSAWHAAGRTA
jgi:uncharacterized membrane protein